MIHSVYFWLHRPEDRTALIAGLETLRAIEGVQSLTIGVPASTEARDVVDGSFDVFEQIVFASTQDQKRYQDHPLHAAFVATCSPLWRKVVVYDITEIA